MWRGRARREPNLACTGTALALEGATSYMAVTAACGCGQTYELRDEFAGKLMQCPSCGGQVRAGAGPGLPPILGDPAFARDRFLLRQKHFAISEKYFVWDDQGQTIMFVVRPAHLLRNFFAVVAGLVGGIGVAT